MLPLPPPLGAAVEVVDAVTATVLRGLLALPPLALALAVPAVTFTLAFTLGLVANVANGNVANGNVASASAESSASLTRSSMLTSEAVKDSD